MHREGSSTPTEKRCLLSTGGMVATTATSSGATPSSSCASRSAVAVSLASPASRLPPGSATSPAAVRLGVLCPGMGHLLPCERPASLDGVGS